MTERQVAAALHRMQCASTDWNEPCQRPDGGDHARLQLPAARRILTSPDPAAELHAHLCDAELDAVSRLRWGGCPQRDQHIEHCRALLPAVLGTPDDLFGAAA